MIVGLAGAVAQSDFAAQPFLIGAWIDHSSFTARQASILAFCETLSLALTMFGVSPRMRAVSLTRLAVFASLLLIAAQVLSSTTRRYVLLAASRSAAGFALGLFSAAANTAAARTGSPERAFAVSTGVLVLLSSGISIILPIAGRDLGSKGMLCALAVMSSVCIPVWKLLPPGRAGSTIDGISVPRHHIPVGAATSVIATMLLFSSGAAAIFAFSERIGHSIGMSPNEIGTTSAIAYLLSLIGPIGVAGLGTRMGRTAPLLVGL
jgi:predicted MFS family arabinose efflux permease